MTGSHPVVAVKPTVPVSKDDHHHQWKAASPEVNTLLTATLVSTMCDIVEATREVCRVNLYQESLRSLSIRDTVRELTAGLIKPDIRE